MQVVLRLADGRPITFSPMGMNKLGSASILTSGHVQHLTYYQSLDHLRGLPRSMAQGKVDI